MANDSIAKTIVVATLLCIVCSVLVSTAAVKLREPYERNKALDKKRNILEVCGIYKEGDDIDELFNKFETRVVSFKTGEFLDDVDVASFDQRQVAKDSEHSEALSKVEDIASIRRREDKGLVYILRENGEMRTIVLPIRGMGLWSTLYGFLALNSDLNTVVGLTFYEHFETPGLGGEVDNPKWKSLWLGKKVFNGEGEVAIQVLKGVAPRNSAEFQHQVDGLAGATITSRGVDNLLEYWLSDQGYGPMIEKLKEGGA